MSRYKDITGLRSGRLVAVKYVGKDKHNNALWLCKCDCGREITTRGANIRSGEIKSCGCLHRSFLVGQRFGRLLVVEEMSRRKRRRIVYKCKCDCGNYTYVTADDLKSGHTQSCGCYMRECTRDKFTTHGNSKDRLYIVWVGIKARCYNKNHHSYRNYGGRGIAVCEEWRDNYEAFRQWALDNGYDSNAERGVCTLDRIDNDKDYEPSNCRWANMQKQMNNTRRNVKLHLFGDVYTISEASRKFGIKYGNLQWKKYCGLSDKDIEEYIIKKGKHP